MKRGAIVAGFLAGLCAVAFLVMSSGTGALGSGAIGGGGGGIPTSGGTFTGPVTFPAGTICSGPSLIVGESGTGIALFGTGSIGVCVGGALAGRIDVATTPGTDNRNNTVVGGGSGLALGSVVGGANNSFFGGESGVKCTTCTVNTYLGERSGHENVTGSENTAIGQGAQFFNTHSLNTAVGYHAMIDLDDVTGKNTAIGDSALENPGGTATGTANTAVGYQAMRGGGTGMSAANSNNAVGASALAGLTTGDDNEAFGNSALLGVTTGQSNIGIGDHACRSVSTTSNNICMGDIAGDVLTGTQNFIAGIAAALQATSADGNVIIGYQAGWGVDGTNKLTTGDNNTFVGFEATTTSATASNQTAIGNGAIATADNQIKLGNTSALTVNIGNGHIMHFNAPSSCNTGSCTTDSCDATATEAFGTITATCNNQTAIVVFTTTYATTPHCTVTPMSATATANIATFSYTTATTGITITQTGNIAAETWAFSCSE